MTSPFSSPSTGADPIGAILDAQGNGVLGIIANVKGPSYRPLGAMMAILHDETRIGSLSSGCIEQDIALHAIETLKSNIPHLIRYGIGSPYMDIELPCGGGLDILLVPNPDTNALRDVASRQAARDGCSLKIEIATGAMTVLNDGRTERVDSILTVRFDPALRFLVFGKGPEASTFAALVKSTGYPVTLVSPDTETLEAAKSIGCQTQPLTSKRVPKGLSVDDRTAIALFFHDHDWEPPILQDALTTDAFYIGSQGSQRARDARVATLEKMGVAPTEIQRLHGPVGLIPSARDPFTLAVSVLAEILANAAKQS